MTENSSQLYIGIMSGTSLDGVDVSVLQIDETTIAPLHNHFTAYSPAIQEEIRQISHAAQWEPDAFYALRAKLTTLYAEAVFETLKELSLETSAVTAIGCHGQTVRHKPDNKFPYSVQMVDGALLAELTHISVVTDFRSRDIAAGGQGAPLAPAFHYAIFGTANPKGAMLNLGGVANLTLWDEAGVAGFDTGPGNLLLDTWMQEAYDELFDDNGERARSGKVNEELLNAMLEESYFKKPTPKSTGRELFNLDWLKGHLANAGDISKEDVLATLVELSATSITEHLVDPQPSHLYVYGGGIHNLYLLERIQYKIPHTIVTTTADLGVPPDFMEAIAFGWLAYRTINLTPSNQPEVTGAKGPRIQGAIYPK